MKRKSCFAYIALTLVLMASAAMSQVRTKQEQKTVSLSSTASQVAPSFGAAVATATVTSSGTPGHLARFLGAPGSGLLGDSIIFEDKFNKVGIGTSNPTSALTVQGMIETTLGGYKFPDGTVQTTALSAGQIVSSLNGLRGDVTLVAGKNISITATSGNTLTIAAPNVLTRVTRDDSLTGDGSASSPLGLAVPLALFGSVDRDSRKGVITAENLLPARLPRFSVSEAVLAGIPPAARGWRALAGLPSTLLKEALE
jgi:hypothetical protein